MNIKNLSITAFAIILTALLASPAAAQSTTFDIEVGYQSIDVDGNEDMFLTQINQDDGFVLRGLSINYIDPSGSAGFADRFRIDASGFGGSPAGRLRLDMGLGTSYRLFVFYQQMNAYSALPRFANPLVDQGIYPGQHTWNRDRDVLDVRLELLPGRVITPIIGYRWNRYEGPGQATYSVGADEFRIASDLEETEQEYYAGLTFATASVQGTFLQGWRDFEGTYRDVLWPGEGAGNNPGTTIGREVELDSFGRTTRTEADTPVTTFHIKGRLSETTRLLGSFVRADYEGDTRQNELLSGSLVSFSIARFFEGLDQSVLSHTDNPYWRGEARFEWDISRKVGMQVGYEARNRELEGWAMISSLYMDTLNFGGFDPQDITTLVEAETGYEREDNIANVRFDFRHLGPFSLWAEYQVNDQDLDVSADVAQIVLPYGQAGEFDRKISSYNLGGMVEIGSSAKLLVDAVSQDADDIVMRTDYNDRFRLRGRFDWTLSRLFRVLLTAETIDSDNDSSGVGYDAQTDRYAVDLTFTPSQNFMLRAAYDSYSTDTEHTYRVPQDFTILPSLYTEDGELLEGNLMWKIAIFDIEAAYSTLENTGSFPFQMDRAFARLAINLSKSISVAGEFENWDYSEDLSPMADYDADRWGVFLRWRR